MMPKTDQPQELFMFDGEWTKLPLQKKDEGPELVGLEKKRARYIQKNKKKTFNSRVFSGKIKTYELLAKSRQVRLIRKRYTREFFNIWNQGIEGYILGEWDTAIEKMTLTRDMIDGIQDGPSKALLKFMVEECGGKVPAEWPGYRPFDDH